MAIAEARFTSALQHAQNGLSGARTAEAQDIVDLALVGRAGSRLNQGWSDYCHVYEANDSQVEGVLG
jgi:hypothetical protein